MLFWEKIWSLSDAAAASLLAQHVWTIFQGDPDEAMDESGSFWFEIAFRNPGLAQDLLTTLQATFVPQPGDEERWSRYRVSRQGYIADGFAVQAKANCTHSGVSILADAAPATSHEEFRRQRVEIYALLLHRPQEALPLVEKWWLSDKQNAYRWGIGEVARRLWKQDQAAAIAFLKHAQDCLTHLYSRGVNLEPDTLYFLMRQCLTQDADDDALYLEPLVDLVLQGSGMVIAHAVQMLDELETPENRARLLPLRDELTAARRSREQNSTAVSA